MGRNADTLTGEGEKNSLLASIKANAGTLTPEEQARFLSRAEAIQTGITQYGVMGNVERNISYEQVQALQSEFQTASNNRRAELLRRRQETATQLQAMLSTPGSKQTTNSVALVPNSSAVSLV